MRRRIEVSLGFTTLADDFESQRAELDAAITPENYNAQLVQRKTALETALRQFLVRDDLARENQTLDESIAANDLYLAAYGYLRAALFQKARQKLQDEGTENPTEEAILTKFQLGAADDNVAVFETFFQNTPHSREQGEKILGAVDN